MFLKKKKKLNLSQWLLFGRLLLWFTQNSRFHLHYMNSLSPVSAGCTCQLYFICCLELFMSSVKSTHSVHRAVLFLHCHAPFALHLSTTQITQQQRHIGLLLTSAISSTLLRNALFFLWNDGQSIQAHWFTSTKVFSCLQMWHAFFFWSSCFSERLPGGLLKTCRDRWWRITGILG